MAFETLAPSDLARPLAAPRASTKRRSPMALSVVIATHNRLDFLTQCLAALAPQVERPDVEVIVVDSCSDADVSRSVGDLARSYGFQFIGLDEPGVSKARNAGAAAAQAPWFATLDDDAVPNAGWVDGALKAIKQAASDAGVIQGRVEPLWIDAKPIIVGPRHARFLSIVMYDKDHEVRGRAHCAGANMLVHRAFHAQIGGYGEAFGRVREALVSGIDTDLVDRMREIGARIFYSNAFSVRHAVHAQRLTRDWVRERSLHDGRAGGRIVFTRHPPLMQATTIVKSLTSVALLSLAAVFAKPSFDLLIRRSVNLGILEQAPVIGPLMHYLYTGERQRDERVSEAMLILSAAAFF
jgi:GT2 family glycosyltransferase